jgi:uncharacterized protein (TIGR03083 family)
MPVLIETLHLFPILDQKLIALLRSLKPEDWSKPTLAKLWTVKDIAAHLLDGNLRTISIMGHHYFGENPGPLNSYQDLVDFLNRLNADWVTAMRRVSPVLLIELLEATGNEYHETLKKLPPFDRSLFAVNWAGESESQNWFHIAREYTEKWHHQQQIREAVDKQGIMDPMFYSPLMNTFMRALPHTYRNTKAREGAALQVIVGSDTWHLVYRSFQWVFEPSSNPAAIVTIDPTAAWKLFTKGITKDQAHNKISLQGDPALCEPILSMISVMA